MYCVSKEKSSRLRLIFDVFLPDEGELLLVEEDGYLLNLSAGSNDLLDNLDTAWRRLGRLLLLLRLELDNLQIRGFTTSFSSSPTVPIF